MMESTESTRDRFKVTRPVTDLVVSKLALLLKMSEMLTMLASCYN